MSEAAGPVFRPERHPIVRAMQACCAVYGRCWHRITLRNPVPLPRHGPAILVCNHVSGLDPILIQSVCPRIIRWMMAREYFDLRRLQWIYSTVGAIPVRRGQRDTAATRAALRALEGGNIVGVFPEGMIETTRELLPFQPGIGLLAAKSGAPVYPVYLEGSQRGKEMVPAFLSHNSASLRFGRPLEMSRGDGYERADAFALRVQNAVECLRRAEYAARGDKNY